MRGNNSEPDGYSEQNSKVLKKCTVGEKLECGIIEVEQNCWEVNGIDSLESGVYGVTYIELMCNRKPHFNGGDFENGKFCYVEITASHMRTKRTKVTPVPARLLAALTELLVCRRKQPIQADTLPLVHHEHVIK